MSYMKLYDYTIHQTVAPEDVVYDKSDYEENKYVEIDEMFSYIIQQLNLKGYRTKFCCSGHYGFDEYVYEGQKYNIITGGYIYFDGAYDLGNLPEFALLESGTSTIRFSFKSEPNTKERHYELLKYINLFSNWVDDLPSIKG